MVADTWASIRDAWGDLVSCRFCPGFTFTLNFIWIQDGTTDGCLGALLRSTLFLCICNVICHPSLIQYTREELLKCEHATGHKFSPFCFYPGIFLELLVGGAAALYGTSRRCRRGKWASAAVKLRQGFRTALLSIHLSILLTIKKMNCCFVTAETRTFADLLPCVLRKPVSAERHPDIGFQILRADHIAELSGEEEGRWNLLLYKQRLVCRCHSVKQTMRPRLGDTFHKL